MKNQLAELTRSHSAMIALAESPLVSPETRLQLLTFIKKLEADIAYVSQAGGHTFAAD